MFPNLLGPRTGAAPSSESGLATGTRDIFRTTAITRDDMAGHIYGRFLAKNNGLLHARLQHLGKLSKLPSFMSIQNTMKSHVLETSITTPVTCFAIHECQGSKTGLDPCPSEGLARCVDRPLLGHTCYLLKSADSHWRPNPQQKPTWGIHILCKHVLAVTLTDKISSQNTWTLHTCFPPQNRPLNHPTSHPNTEVPRVAIFINPTKINPPPNKTAWVLPSFSSYAKCPR